MRERNFTRRPPQNKQREAVPLAPPAIRVAVNRIIRGPVGEAEDIAPNTTFAISDANELAEYEALQSVREPTDAERALFDRGRGGVSASASAASATASAAAASTSVAAGGDQDEQQLGGGSDEEQQEQDEDQSGGGSDEEQEQSGDDDQSGLLG